MKLLRFLNSFIHSTNSFILSPVQTVDMQWAAKADTRAYSPITGAKKSYNHANNELFKE